MKILVKNLKKTDKNSSPTNLDVRSESLHWPQAIDYGAADYPALDRLHVYKCLTF